MRKTGGVAASRAWRRFKSPKKHEEKDTFSLGDLEKLGRCMSLFLHVHQAS